MRASAFRSVFKYGDAVHWLALNDDPAELRVSFVRGSVAVQLVADAWRVPAAQVAADVVKLRVAARVAAQVTP